MGPGTTQILRISGFVQTKKCKENGTLFSGSSSDLQRKMFLSKLKRFFCPNSGDLKKKKRSLMFHFDGPYEAQWALSWAPSNPWAPIDHGLPDGPPKIHGPRGHCPLCSPLSEALSYQAWQYGIFSFANQCLLKSTVCLLLIRYALFVKVRVQYLGTLFNCAY